MSTNKIKTGKKQQRGGHSNQTPHEEREEKARKSDKLF
jgi:hypothetical protein